MRAERQLNRHEAAEKNAKCLWNIPAGNSALGDGGKNIPFRNPAEAEHPKVSQTQLKVPD